MFQARRVTVASALIGLATSASLAAEKSDAKRCRSERRREVEEAIAHGYAASRITAALNGVVTDAPQGRKVGRFTVIDGGD